MSVASYRLAVRRGRVRMVGIAATAVMLGGVALAAPSGAVMVPPVDGTGSVSCAVAGTLSFSPALSAIGPAVATTVTFKTRLTGCTGTGSGATVKGGSSSVSGTSPTNDCLGVLTGEHASRSGSLKWTTLPHTTKLNPSTIAFEASAGAVLGTPITIDVSGASTGGSFAGDAAAAHVALKEDQAKIVKLCTGRAGLKALHFLAGSTFTLSA